MSATRIPDLESNTFDGMLAWFAEMSVRDLIFHPDDAPDQVMCVTDGKPMFSARECREIGNVLGAMFEMHGDRVHAACYPVFMRAAGQLRLDA